MGGRGGSEPAHKGCEQGWGTGTPALPQATGPHHAARLPSPPPAPGFIQLTVRCTQEPLAASSSGLCWSRKSTRHSYQPWSSARSPSIWRDAPFCSRTRPGRGAPKPWSHCGSLRAQEWAQSPPVTLIKGGPAQRDTGGAGSWRAGPSTQPWITPAFQQLRPCLDQENPERQQVDDTLS